MLDSLYYIVLLGMEEKIRADSFPPLLIPYYRNLPSEYYFLFKKENSLYFFCLTQKKY